MRAMRGAACASIVCSVLVRREVEWWIVTVVAARRVPSM